MGSFEFKSSGVSGVKPPSPGSYGTPDYWISNLSDPGLLCFPILFNHDFTDYLAVILLAEKKQVLTNQNAAYRHPSAELGKMAENVLSVF